MDFIARELRPRACDSLRALPASNHERASPSPARAPAIAKSRSIELARAYIPACACMKFCACAVQRARDAHESPSVIPGRSEGDAEADGAREDGSRDAHGLHLPPVLLRGRGAG